MLAPRPACRVQPRPNSRLVRACTHVIQAKPRGQIDVLLLVRGGAVACGHPKIARQRLHVSVGVMIDTKTGVKERAAWNQNRRLLKYTKTLAGVSPFPWETLLAFALLDQLATVHTVHICGCLSVPLSLSDPGHHHPHPRQTRGKLRSDKKEPFRSVGWLSVSANLHGYNYIFCV